MDRYPFKFDCPMNCIIYGQSQSGKSTFIQKVFDTPEIWQQPIDRCFYFYGIESEALNDIKKKHPDFVFIKGLPQNLEELFDENLLECAVFDDLTAEIERSAEFTQFLTRVTHHKRIACFVLCHFIFSPAKEKRLQAQNYHVLIIFGNKRASQQIQTLARQCAVCEPKFMSAVYADATKKPHAYLIVDLRQTAPMEQKLVTNIFLEHNDPVWLYM